MKRYPVLLRTVFNVLTAPQSDQYIKYMAFQAIPDKLEYSNWFQSDIVAFPDNDEIEKYNNILNREYTFGKLIKTEFTNQNIGKVIAEYGSLEAYKYYLNNYDILKFGTQEWYCTNLFIRANKLDKDHWSDQWYRISRLSRRILAEEDF